MSDRILLWAMIVFLGATHAAILILGLTWALA
jgi:hypothetical protein